MKCYTLTDQIPNLTQIGGKALNLYRLKKMGLNVPNFAVIDQAELIELIPVENRNIESYPTILQLIDDFSFPTDFLEKLLATFQKTDQKRYAVRSSALMEDGKSHSFAGQFESFLYVEWNDLQDRIKAVWRSNFSNRVASYLQTNGLKPQFGMGVIIQEMIDPDVSGVAFGINPNTGILNSKVICSVYGVGEGLVSGALNADTFNLNGDTIEAILVKKEQMAVHGKSGEIKFESVPTENQMRASLSEKNIREIAQKLNLLTTELQAPQDVEFALKDDVLYFLQTRPITAIAPPPPLHSEKNRIIWDNSNIVESYPGVTTPLTFSYIKTAYQNVYRQLALLMGASQKTVDQNEAVFANMLGLINGRVYYNLLSWYKVLALFPGYSLNAQFMENMMGVKERFILEKDTRTSKISALWRTAIMLTKIIYHSITIRKTSRRFLEDVNASLAQVKGLDLDNMTAYELKTTWVNLDGFLVPKWKAPVINDSFAMIYFGRLQKLIERYKIGSNGNLQNDLLCGSKDIISVEPIHESIKLATKIGKNLALKALFVENDPAEIWAKLDGDPFKKEIDIYLEKFGDRCVGELKLETISFKQDPSLFLATLKSFVKQNVTTQSTASTVDMDLRQAAEAEVKKHLKNPFKRRKFNKILKKTRYFVSNRENLRYERTRVFGITREIFTAIGKQFEHHKVLTHHRDIFYLTKTEIFAFIDGTAVTQSLKKLVEIRKAEFNAYKDQPAPADRITTFETVHIGNDFFNTSSEIEGETNLHGLGCCPGIVRARVRIVKHPGEVESLNGDILVTSSTDPGWVTLFPTASAILVERGSLLSHSAIVSREMGIPCIVGITGLLKQLKTGDEIEMNGSTGTIKRIKDA